MGQGEVGWPCEGLNIFLWKLTHLEIPEKTEKFGNSLTQYFSRISPFSRVSWLPSVLSWPFVREEIAKVVKWAPGTVSGDSDGGSLWRCYGCAGEAWLKRSCVWEQLGEAEIAGGTLCTRPADAGRHGQAEQKWQENGVSLDPMAWCSTQRLSTCVSQWLWFRGAAG